jgi:hypothetical protein
VNTAVASRGARASRGGGLALDGLGGGCVSSAPALVLG